MINAEIDRMLTEEESELLDELETETREAMIILCPHCPHEFEENPGVLTYGREISCPRCNYRWINVADVRGLELPKSNLLERL